MQQQHRAHLCTDALVGREVVSNSNCISTETYQALAPAVRCYMVSGTAQSQAVADFQNSTAALRRSYGNMMRHSSSNKEQDTTCIAHVSLYMHYSAEDRLNAREQWSAVGHLSKDAAYAPYINWCRVLSTTHQHIRCSVPQCDHLMRVTDMCIHGHKGINHMQQQQHQQKDLSMLGSSPPSHTSKYFLRSCAQQQCVECARHDQRQLASLHNEVHLIACLRRQYCDIALQNAAGATIQVQLPTVQRRI
eukprot:11113-Heterococcus_DN1.PRE.1